ncbi:Signal transduction histidine kinase [Nakamurella panacisegetis]|uniref:Signal transduction histidine-protein kinase/phosphatase MprB n=1 Tax=Nakamurella panacisegetis TaxID=1090615 RepID=A0A1H0KY68_9ACTN|nr:HAMP domain-containing sensor histidine kinase [Nakamurella panacisegetis]SDO60974.1 Signal transduction histidine kinase [Nakamurella panacisegetis]
MRWRITLLVAATTSLVLLAFLIPAGYLVARVAHNNAVSRGQLQVQALIPVLALSSTSGTTVAVRNVADAGYLVWVTAVGAPTIGADPAGRALDGSGLTRADVTEVDAVGGAPGGVLIAQPVIGPGGSSVIRLLVTDDQLSAGVTRIWLLLGGIGLLLFLLSLLLADRFARSMSCPITALAGTAARLGSGDLAARVTPAGPPEVARVGTALNRLGGRIDELLVAEREAVADLSHRLRTPITALRLDAEAVTDPSQRQRLSEDLRSLDQAVDDIIRSARRASASQPGRCDAAGVVRDRMVFWKVLASHQNRPLVVAVDQGELPVDLAATELAAALDALVGNVFAHTPDGTAFEVGCRPSADAVEVSVLDSGPGFDQANADRGESGGGSTGLGLDIARQAAAATGGRLIVGRRPDGRTEIRMRLGRAIASS